MTAVEGTLFKLHNGLIGLMVVVCASLVGCSVAFDAPPGAKDIGQEASAKVLDDLKSAKEAAGRDAQWVPAQTRTSVTAGGPILTFERAVAAMPQLAVQKGLDKGVILIDEEKVSLGEMTRTGFRIALIAPGRRNLRVECPFDPPFSASFYVEKNDRIVLRGDCSSQGGGGTAGRHSQGSGNAPVLSFSKTGADIPQLSIHEMGDAVIKINGRKIGSDGVMGVDRMITIQPGNHTLEVEYPGEAPFRASFYIEAGERATLRGKLPQGKLEGG